MQKPTPTRGMHHIALQVKDLTRCEHFYTELLGMKVEWRPDPKNVYLTSGTDNLALHSLPEHAVLAAAQRLDHLGFILGSPEEVDQWHDYLCHHGVEIKAAPRTHRDGARSFYCADPDGTIVQMIYHPPLITA